MFKSDEQILPETSEIFHGITVFIIDNIMNMVGIGSSCRLKVNGVKMLVENKYNAC